MGTLSYKRRPNWRFVNLSKRDCVNAYYFLGEEEQNEKERYLVQSNPTDGTN